jgi:hypothetical protein
MTHVFLRKCFLLLLAILVMSATNAAALDVSASLPIGEQRKIESLIALVEHLPNAVFVRNGTAYGPATAARFLRGKWEARAAEIRSARDFVQKVASFSSMTGRSYTVRYADGREIPTGEFFKMELEKLR